MNCLEYLTYSSKEPMTTLRRMFNRGQSVYKSVPKTITAEEALTDVLYVRYVFENAYSGYSYYDRALFDNAFEQIAKSVRSAAEITPNQLIDCIGSRLSFISDGHLALSTLDYGAGFYKKLQTYVSDMTVCKKGDAYYEPDSGKRVSFDETVRAFPTLGETGTDVYLLGVRSKTPIEEISAQLDGRAEILPLHKIMSGEAKEESLLEERYEGNTAMIACSSFVGDSEEAMDRMYRTGKKCREYRHVVWDLSNNLGGNSEFPKRFLTGLYGGAADSVKILELQSTLVHAKETGEIKDVPYRLKEAAKAAAPRGDLFPGELHVILNDRVASSAELAIAWAASRPRVTFYGCSSLGIGRFGDLCIYYLPNSRIVLWCPQKVFDAGIQETAGFEPDYWLDSQETVSVVLNRIAKNQTNA